MFTRVASGQESHPIEIPVRTPPAKIVTTPPYEGELSWQDLPRRHFKSPMASPATATNSLDSSAVTSPTDTMSPVGMWSSAEARSPADSPSPTAHRMQAKIRSPVIVKVPAGSKSLANLRGSAATTSPSGTWSPAEAKSRIEPTSPVAVRIPAGNKSIADLRGAADTASSVRHGNVAYTRGPAVTSKPGIRKAVPILILDTNVSFSRNPDSSVGSSALTKHSGQTNVSSSTTAVRDFAIDGARDFSLPGTPRKPPKIESAVDVRESPAVIQFDDEHLQQAFGVSSPNYLIANFSASSLINPFKVSKVPRPWNPDLNSPSSSPLSGSHSPKGCAGSARQNTSNVTSPLSRHQYHNDRKVKGKDPIQSTGESTPPQINPEGLSMYSLPPPPDFMRCNQIPMPASTVQRSLGPLGVKFCDDDKISPAPAKEIEIPRKNGSSGSAKRIFSGKKILGVFQGRKSGGRSGSGAAENDSEKTELNQIENEKKALAKDTEKKAEMKKEKVVEYMVRH